MARGWQYARRGGGFNTSPKSSYADRCVWNFAYRHRSISYHVSRCADHHRLGAYIEIVTIARDNTQA